MRLPGITVGLSRAVHRTVDHAHTIGNHLPDDIEPLLSTSGRAAATLEGREGG